MPLSSLTRLRGVIIIAAFAFALLWLEISDQMWALATGFLLMPLLVWLLVSNAVKEAPPFDDTAFHRTRPVTAGQVYRHLVGFLLLVLGCILLLVLAYVWRFNLGWREAVFGMVTMAIPLISLGSLFGTTASLSNSPAHWKGWPFVLLLLIPSISFFLFCATQVQNFQQIPFAPLTFAGCVMYPALWWLVAVKRRWLIGTVLGAWVGVAMPWLQLPIMLPETWLQPEVPERTAALDIQRLKTPVHANGMSEDQAIVSRMLEVRGLGQDEFIQMTRATQWTNEPRTRHMEHDDSLADMSGASFSTDSDGRLLPATTSLLRVMGNAKANSPWWDNRPEYLRDQTLEDHMRLLSRRFASGSKRIGPPLPETQAIGWSLSGRSYRWMKALDVPAMDGGQAKLPDKGRIRVLPLEETSGDFGLTLLVTRPTDNLWSYQTWDDSITPVVIARSPSGEARFIDLQASIDRRYGFLTAEKEYEFRDQIRQPRGNERLKILRDSQLEVYWTEFRGTFSVTLPSPK